MSSKAKKSDSSRRKTILSVSNFNDSDDISELSVYESKGKALQEAQPIFHQKVKIESCRPLSSKVKKEGIINT